MSSATRHSLLDRTSSALSRGQRYSLASSRADEEEVSAEDQHAAQQFFHTNLAARRCYWHNNRYTIGWPNPVLSY